MDILEFLRSACALPGTPGYERGMTAFLCEEWQKKAGSVCVDAMGNVIADVGEGKVHVMIAAHQDEIGLAVADIEDDGCVRFVRNGGVDPRILPGMEVRIEGRQGWIPGIVASRPFCEYDEGDERAAVKLENLFIDTGFSAEELRDKLEIGAPVTFAESFCELTDGALSAKTMDDRASIAAMLIAAEELKQVKGDFCAQFVSTTQEEIGSKGAATAAYTLHPDFAIAIDVTHGKGPGMDKWQGSPLDKLALCRGSFVHPVLWRAAEKAARENGIPFEFEICADETWTDADAIRTVRGGIPTMLISIPLRYMHTTVETLRLQVIRDTGRLIAATIRELTQNWEEIQWF